MRALNQYRLSEWVQAEPLVHGFKRARNMAVSRAFRAAHPAGLERFVQAYAPRMQGTVAFTIAYNAPWAIELVTRMAARHLDFPLVVLDNSRDPAARMEIERLCREREVPCLGLPHNPERHPCRSNGIALNWAWYNLVRAWQPEIAVFLDHDLMPYAPADFGAALAGQPVYGVLNRSTWGWNLWAGFCAFDVGAVDGRQPDFNHDVPRGLDTGGCNYARIYRHLSFDAVRFADWRYQPVQDPDGSGTVAVNLVDRFVHIGGAGFPGTRQHAGTPAFYRRLVEYVEAGGALEDLILPERVPGPRFD